MYEILFINIRLYGGKLKKHCNAFINDHHQQNNISWLEPTNCGDDDEGNGDAGDDFSCHGSVGLLYEIPQADLVLDKLSAPEIFLNLRRNCSIIMLATTWKSVSPLS